MKYVLMLLATMLLALPIQAAPVTWYWTIPTTGAPVEFYEVECQTNGQEWVLIGTPSENELTVDMVDGSSIVRVRGVDAQDQRGPWSEESEVYIQYPAPGMCGRPTIQEE